MAFITSIPFLPPATLQAMKGNTLTFEDVRPCWKKIAERTAFYWDSESRTLR